MNAVRNVDDFTIEALGVQKVRKKPIIVHAMQMTGPFEVTTKEGAIIGQAGDFLMFGVQGEKYPCAKDIFEASYDILEEEGMIEPKTPVARAIWSDLCNRSGFDLGGLDEETQQDIAETWEKIETEETS